MRIILFLLVVLLVSLTACAGEVTITETSLVSETSTQAQTIVVTETQTVTATTLTGEPKPIEVVSVLDTYKIGQTVIPAGPTVEITLKNIAEEPIISLIAILELGRPFEFTFDVSPSNPLLPGESISKRQVLIMGGFSDDKFYPLRVELIYQNQPNCVYFYSEQVQIVELPAE